MKTLLVVLLFFVSWWGFIAYALLALYADIPDRWYIALSLFLLASAWGFIVQAFARWYRDKS